MSDKSTYLRQIMLLTILAQLGCYIPTESACFRIPDRIFSRASNRDCIETNLSTFMIEMQILSNVGPFFPGHHRQLVRDKLFSCHDVRNTNHYVRNTITMMWYFPVSLTLVWEIIYHEVRCLSWCSKLFFHDMSVTLIMRYFNILPWCEEY